MKYSSLPVQYYLVDTITVLHPASGMAAVSITRFTFGFAFPLFGAQMFAKLGNGGGNSLLAGVAIILGIPFPVWLWFYGERIRQRSKYSR